MKKILLSLLLFTGSLPVVFTARAQSTYEPYFFGTLAGYSGYGSADGTGSAARFYGPFGTAVDSAGNVYVADSNNHTIRKVTAAGVVTTLAGLPGATGSADGTGSAARFNYPTGVAVDSAGSVYVADSSNNTVRKVTSAGVVTTLAGLAGSFGSADGTGNAARFYGLTGIAVDGGGNVYVADHNNHTIRKVTSTGVVTTLAGLAGGVGSADGAGSAARFYYPTGVAVDSGGNVYVADSFNHTIRKMTSAGVVTTLAGSAGGLGSADGAGSAARFNYPTGVTVDGGGNISVADQSNHTIRKVTSTGVVTTLAGLAGSIGSADGTGSAARFNYPAGLAVDSGGNVYVADTNNNTIRKVMAAGAVTTLAGLAGSIGGADGTGSAARFNQPAGMAVDSGGNAYVADLNNHTIRKVTSAGVVTTLAGLAGSIGSADGTGSAARFNSPYGVTVDSGGNVYVADLNNHTIRKVTSAGVVTTLAGLAGSFGSADGTGNAARFYNPTGVTVDSGGNVYVADSNNDTIRKVTAAGVVTTMAGLAGVVGSADGTGSAARFNSPTGLAVDSGGNVSVADQNNHTIRKVTSAGVVTTLAGLAQTRGSADGIGSAARFNYPTGLAVDSGGNVYVSDASNNTIRVGEIPLAITTAASRKTHAAVGSFDVSLALSGTPSVEPRTGGANGDHTLIFTLNHPLTRGSASVTSGSGSVAGTPAVSGTQLFVNLTGIANAQAVTVTLTNVVDSIGQPLPDTAVSAGFLLGDSSGDGSVNSGDATITRNRSGQGTDATNFRSDFNVDGSVNSADVTAVRARSGTFIP